MSIVPPVTREGCPVRADAAAGGQPVGGHVGTRKGRPDPCPTAPCFSALSPATVVLIEYDQQTERGDERDC